MLLNSALISLFLSTPSARRATPRSAAETKKPEYFYPRPPRGGRPPKGIFHGVVAEISIHALREEGDSREIIPNTNHNTFLSTPSARRATKTAFANFKDRLISIHALREEGDAGGCDTAI